VKNLLVDLKEMLLPQSDLKLGEIVGQTKDGGLVCVSFGAVESMHIIRGYANEGSAVTFQNGKVVDLVKKEETKTYKIQ